jgi:hypothetical protein
MRTAFVILGCVATAAGISPLQEWHMRSRTSRLGRWRRKVSAATKLVLELVRLVEALTLLTSKLTRFAYGLVAFAAALSVLVATLSR